MLPLPLFTLGPCEAVLPVVVGALPPVVVVVVLLDEVLMWGLPPPFEDDPFEFTPWLLDDACGLPAWPERP